jgi:hypothetical protein
LRSVVNRECDIADAKHAWIRCSPKVTEIMHGTIYVPHHCARSDGERWNDGAGACAGAADRLTLVIHPEGHPDGVSHWQRQLTDHTRIPYHWLELQHLRAGPVDRRGTRAAWIGDAGFRYPWNLSAVIGWCHSAVVSAERRQQRN